MKYIDIHTHGGLGVNFNTSEHNEIKMLLKELYKLQEQPEEER